MARLGRARVVFLNYCQDGPPSITQPEIILIRRRQTNAMQFKTGKYWEDIGVSVVTSHMESRFSSVNKDAQTSFGYVLG